MINDDDKDKIKEDEIEEIEKAFRTLMKIYTEEGLWASLLRRYGYPIGDTPMLDNFRNVLDVYKKRSRLPKTIRISCPECCQPFRVCKHIINMIKDKIRR